MQILASIYIHTWLKFRIWCWNQLAWSSGLKPCILPRWLTIKLHKPDGLIKEFELKRRFKFTRKLQQTIVDRVRANMTTEESII